MSESTTDREATVCNRIALLATVAAAGCYALSGHWQGFLLTAIALTLLRAALNVAASYRAHRPLPDRYSDMLLVAGVAVSGLVDWHWPVVALGSMLIASATGVLAHVPGLDGKPFGPTGVIARLVCLMIATACHWVFVAFSHTPWTLGGAGAGAAERRGGGDGCSGAGHSAVALPRAAAAGGRPAVARR